MLVAPDVDAGTMSRDHELADGRRIAQAEIEALRTDRRHHMRGLADQRHAPRGELRCGLDRQGKYATAGLDLDLAQDRMRAPLDLHGQLGVAERMQARDLGRIDHEYQARAPPRQRHQGEGAGLGMEFGRDVMVRTAVRQVQREGTLRIGVVIGRDCGGDAAQRMPAFGADREPRRHHFAACKL